MTWQKPFQWDGKDKSLIRLNSKENKRRKIEESIDYLLRNLPPQTSREMGAIDGNSFGLMKRSSQGHGLHFFFKCRIFVRWEGKCTVESRERWKNYWSNVFE